MSWLTEPFDLSANFSLNFASGHQDKESLGEEFDTDSEREEAVGDDSEDIDELKFLRAVTTRSGQAVQVIFFFSLLNTLLY